MDSYFIFMTENGAFLTWFQQLQNIVPDLDTSIHEVERLATHPGMKFQVAFYDGGKRQLRTGYEFYEIDDRYQWSPDPRDIASVKLSSV